jgi:hypothetical protein
MAKPHGTKNIEAPEKMWEYFEAYVKERRYENNKGSNKRNKS